jgi:hypothetical protein
MGILFCLPKLEDDNPWYFFYFLVFMNCKVNLLEVLGEFLQGFCAQGDSCSVLLYDLYL